MIITKLFLFIWGFPIRFYSGNKDLHPVTPLYWTITNLPVVFHSAVTLSCKVPTSMKCCPKTRKWKGGNPPKVLLYNGSSTNSSKYLEELEQNGFNLVIINFSKEDMNVNYSCHYEFLSFSKNLTLAEESYTIEPKDKTVNFHYDINAGKIAVNVTVEQVYPWPQCTAVFKDVNISANVSGVKIGLAYHLSILSAFILNNETCIGKFKLTCQVRSSNHLLADEDLQNICESSKTVTGEISGCQCCCCSAIIIHVTVFSISQYMLFELNLL